MCAIIVGNSHTRAGMWAAKLPGECARMYDAAVAVAAMMTQVGMAIDGGKDSLSMAARCPIGPPSASSESNGTETEMVKAPGALVIRSVCVCVCTH